MLEVCGWGKVVVLALLLLAAAVGVSGVRSCHLLVKHVRLGLRGTALQRCDQHKRQSKWWWD